MLGQLLLPSSSPVRVLVEARNKMVRRTSLRSRQPRLRFSKNLNARFSSQSVPRLERNAAMCAAVRRNRRQWVDPCPMMAGIPVASPLPATTAVRSGVQGLARASLCFTRNLLTPYMCFLQLSHIRYGCGCQTTGEQQCNNSLRGQSSDRAVC